jgi:hypothetical protein
MDTTERASSTNPPLVPRVAGDMGLNRLTIPSDGSKALVGWRVAPCDGEDRYAKLKVAAVASVMLMLIGFATLPLLAGNTDRRSHHHGITAGVVATVICALVEATRARPELMAWFRRPSEPSRWCGRCGQPDGTRALLCWRRATPPGNRRVANRRHRPLALIGNDRTTRHHPP